MFTFGATNQQARIESGREPLCRLWSKENSTRKNAVQREAKISNQNSCVKG